MERFQERLWLQTLVSHNNSFSSFQLSPLVSPFQTRALIGLDKRVKPNTCCTRRVVIRCQQTKMESLPTQDSAEQCCTHKSTGKERISNIDLEHQRVILIRCIVIVLHTSSVEDSIFVVTALAWHVCLNTSFQGQGW